MVHLINYSGGLTRPFESIRTLENIRVSVRTRRTSMRALRAGRTLTGERDGEWLCVTLARLELFESLVMD